MGLILAYFTLSAITVAGVGAFIRIGMNDIEE